MLSLVFLVYEQVIEKVSYLLIFVIWGNKLFISMIFYFFLFVSHVRDPPIQPSSKGEGDFKRQKVVKENMKLNQNFQEVIWGRGGLLKLKLFPRGDRDIPWNNTGVQWIFSN